MKTMLLVVLVALPAVAEESVLSKLSLGLDTVGAISLTQARTQGGIGGGVQAAFSFDEHWLVHARAAWLWGLGSHTLFHAGGGWQRSGTWRPLFRGDVTLGLGGSLDFSVGSTPPTRAPTVGLVVGAALLRFQVGRVIVSGLELEAGVSTEFVSVGPRAGLTLLSLSALLE